MRRTACVIAAGLAWVGCQRRGEPPPPPPPASEPPAQVAAAAPAPTAAGSGYVADITTLCDAVTRSGADLQPGANRQLLIAMWLGDHIQTSDAHQFLVRIQPLAGAAKADALDAEAHRVGLAGCALAVEWRAPGATP